MRRLREPGFYWVRRNRGAELEVAELVRPSDGGEGWFAFAGAEGIGSIDEDPDSLYWIGERLVPPDDARD